MALEIESCWYPLLWPMISRLRFFSSARALHAKATRNITMENRTNHMMTSPCSGFWGLDQLPHKLSGELRIVVGVLNADGLTVNDRQLMTQLIPEVPLVADVAHGPDEVAVVIVGIDPNDPVVALEA